MGEEGLVLAPSPRHCPWVNLPLLSCRKMEALKTIGPHPGVSSSLLGVWALGSSSHPDQGHPALTSLLP